ncbi:MAG: flagellar biosynthetic protein FliR [Clostridiales bacterium]|nr:flagellar biosynthetic protein FliR [Clostridiales bacterium]
MVEFTFSLVNVEILILILVRISCFIFAAPFFGMRNVPSRVKIGLSVFVSLLVYLSVDKTGIGYTGMIGYAVIVLKEGITGLLIGLAANICNSIILFAGNIIDMDIGLSMAMEFNPMANAQVTISGNLYNYFLLLMMIATNMHHYILRATIDSYQVIPINGQVFQWDSLMTSMIRFMTDMFVIAFRIVLPVFACIMILNCILGIMAKVAPQMNMFSVGLQMKVLVGLGVLLLTVTLLPGISDFIFTEMKRMVVSMIKGMY